MIAAEDLIRREAELQVLERRLLVDIGRHPHKGMAAGGVVAELDQWLAAERASYGVPPEMLAIVATAARTALDTVIRRTGGIELSQHNGPDCLLCRWLATRQES